MLCDGRAIRRFCHPPFAALSFTSNPSTHALKIGNTNSRYRFPLGVRRFVNDWNSHGPAHHCAVGVGHIDPKLAKLGALLKMGVIQVC